MARYRKKPIEVDAHQWFENGDHPDDDAGRWLTDPFTGLDYQASEGQVVRYFRHPEIDGHARHCDLPDTKRPNCTAIMHDHGWIDTIEGGHTVCPGDWIITGIEDERYPCEPSIFDRSYERVTEAHTAYRSAETGRYTTAEQEQQ